MVKSLKLNFTGFSWRFLMFDDTILFSDVSPWQPRVGASEGTDHIQHSLAAKVSYTFRVHKAIEYLETAWILCRLSEALID